MSKENPPDANPEIDLPPIPEPLLPDASATPELQTVNTTTAEDAPNYFEFREVCKSFDGRVVLDHVTFQVKRGETCVIMGRSGVGKSVTLKHILGFIKPDSGQVFIDGQDVADWTEEEFQAVRYKVSMVFQSGALFDSLTVEENIAFPLEGQPGLSDDDIISMTSSTSVSLKIVVFVVTRKPRLRAVLMASTAISQRPG